MCKKQYPVIDLFAGPGGLSEGFSSFGLGGKSKSPSLFSVVVSVEKEKTAHATLMLRSYYRGLIVKGLSLTNYYAWLNGESETYKKTVQEDEVWSEAKSHALLHELGVDLVADEELENHILAKLKGFDRSSVLIGGPPCQAYSLVGRARNKGNSSYSAEEDHRHFLYREYLKILYRTEPSIFVMENVKGILSSKVNGERIFPSILKDLVAPHEALGKELGKKYVIYSLVTNRRFRYGDDPASVEGTDFLIRSEHYGIPQKRHRVILLGIEESIDVIPDKLRASTTTINVRDVTSGLPPLRSRLSKGGDSSEKWVKIIKEVSQELIDDLKKSEQLPELVGEVKRLLNQDKRIGLDDGGLRVEPSILNSEEQLLPLHLESWYQDNCLNKVLNHESRGHIKEDLKRYLFIATYGKIYGISPKASEFPSFLAPEHKSWHSGKFADRFRVQLSNSPSATMTSHISKDGHYFIHPDPTQCRSLTVREAARLQTFPDNYFFMGPRTQQYVQVGNAVPPLLARQIAQVVHGVLEKVGEE